MNKIIRVISIIIIFLLLSSCEKYDDFLSIHIIDVGQGDCILVKTPDDKNILIDGGDENNDRIIKSYLKSTKVKNFDAVIATHIDKDHIGSLDYVVQNYPIKKFYIPNQSNDTSHYKNLVNACNDKNLEINYLYKDYNLKIDNDINISVLSPSYIESNNNLNSIVFNLSYKDMDFLFTGDCEEKNEVYMVNSYNLDDIDFLKVAHHGSSSSSIDSFIKETSPMVAAISCGYKNNYGHPHKSTLDTLKKYNVKTYRTDINGHLIFYSDGYKIFTTQNYKAN